ncbi:mechanosensitive ion channel family protein [Roseovarius aestuariivivens]|uniref:mechanosensitive ion channel family protein n=1 Tax=Roseovarius aestuariivivens TaxID=1888910 RepID=UPI0010803650|nr:mechanosensitive ion channel family protein [Roseovarius aestuariivivens]
MTTRKPRPDLPDPDRATTGDECLSSRRSRVTRRAAWVVPKWFGSLVVLCLVVVLPTGPGGAQVFGLSAQPQRAATETSDPLGRDTPRGLVKGLIAALAAEDYDRAARYFQGGTGVGIPAWRLPMIKTALNSAGALKTSRDLSLQPEGALDDGLGADLEQIGTLGQGEGEEPLLARRIEGDEGMIWLVATETGQVLSRWRAGSAENATLLRYLVGWLPPGPSIGGVPIRDWGLLMALADVSFAVAHGLMLTRRWLVRLLGRRAEGGRFSRFVSASEPPLKLLVAAVIFSLCAGMLGVSLVARYQSIWIVELAAWFAAAWFVWRLIDTMADATLARMSRHGAISAYSAVMFFSRLAKVVAAGIFLAVALRALGVDITAGLAALGVGGLALAFGAQKLIENLIGSVTLIADRPVRVGDFCKFGETLGTVEEIGIRSTKIRTLARTVVTVPNGEFSSLHLENFARRDTYLFHHMLGVRYETSPDVLRGLLSRLRQLLRDHPNVSPDSARVRFVRFGAHSLDLEIFAYIHASEWNDYLEIQEELMLSIMECVEDAGTGFAFPSQTLYVGKDPGVRAAMPRATE